MKLVISEKSTLKKKIGLSLGGSKNSDGDYNCPDDFLIAGLEGHCKDAREPHEYDIKWKDRSFNSLPIVPGTLEYKPATDDYRLSKYSHIKKLIPLATAIYHAGDPDREGQAIVDNIIKEFNLKVPVFRLWLTNLSDIPSSFINPLSNDDPQYVQLGKACYARTFADWLIGMNYSRAIQNLLYANGYNVNISIGRIQTPTLKLVVDRYRAVSKFKKKYHYSLSVELSNGNDTFSAELVFDDAIKLHLDEDGQLTDKTIIDNIIQEISNEIPIVTAYSNTRKKEKAPLPYTTPKLIAESIKRFGYSVKNVEKITQTLYENGAIDYPRTDYEYLSEDALLKAPAKLDQLMSLPQFSKLTPDYSIKSRAWDNSKLKAHEGITPISTNYLASATEEEINVFNLVAIRFLMQFYPDYEFDHTEINVKLGKYQFDVKSNTPKVTGWKGLASSSDEDNEVATTPKLPELVLNQSLSLIGSKVNNKETKPPKLFTEDSLMLAMCNVANYVDDIIAEYESITGEAYCDNVEEYKSILRLKPEEGGQLGTGATQGTTIQTIQDRNFVAKNEKGQLIPTWLGLLIIDFFLHKETIKQYSFLINPITSASYEKQLAEIQYGTLSEDDFINEFKINTIENKVTQLEQFAHLIPKNPEAIICPTCNQGYLFLKKYKVKDTGQIKEFFGCSRHPECKGAYESDNGKPVLVRKPKSEIKCPVCSDGFLIKKTSISKKTGKDYDWYFCTNYKTGCTTTYFDDNGKPQLEPKPEAKLTGKKCPQCKVGDMVIRQGKKGPFEACNQYPKCEYVKNDKSKKPAATSNKPWLK